MVASEMILAVFIATLGSALCNTANDYPMCTSETDGWTLAGVLSARGETVTKCKNNCRNDAGTTFCAVRRRGGEDQYADYYCGEDPPETSEAGCTYNCPGSGQCGGSGGLRSVYPVCPLGTYGWDCGTSCGHCLDDYCQATSGECPSGCVDGYYSAGCTATCSPNCVHTTCDRSTGACHGGCENGWYTPQCRTFCPVNCDTSCDISSGDCEGCQPGWYFNKCTERCPENCTNTLCDQTTGGCFSCNPGWYTGNCDVPCSENCAQTSCNMASGACDGGCKDGWFDPYCTSQCPTNCDPYVCMSDGGDCDGGCKKDYFGLQCDQPCHTNCYMKCDMNTGDCTHGCDDGYYGAVCDLNCPTNCDGLHCKNDSGNCHSCQEGFHEVTCNATCPINCEGFICNMADGVCTHGCKAGWNGTSCDEDIDECSQPTLNNCSDHGSGLQCYNFEGYFICCKYGLDVTGNNTICISDVDGLSTPAIIGICVSVFVLVAAVLVAVMLLWRKRTMKPSQKGNDGEANFAFQGTRPKETIADPPSVKDVDYSNISGTSEHAIGLSNFVDYVKAIVRGEHNIAVEYEDLPSGELHDCGQSQRPELKQKNKFKGIYPYNYNRVVLDQISDDPTTDYINASRIQGYRPDDKFIASLGPRHQTIADFWRMVWQENVVTIVMLTNLVEAGLEKCEQYWPSEKSQRYGDLQVTSESDDEWPTYHIRRLTLNKGNSKRRVTQYHFTQWPDHGVPSEATALLNFRRKALGGNPRTAPVLVHCSAGVGRTGTLIALDYLIKQGETEGKMDVYNCVYNLRQQRIRMIQTMDQYTFLHEALADCVRVGVTALSTSSFRENYTRIIDKHRGGVLSEQFEALQDLSPKVSFDDYACSSANVDKNRDPGIIPIMSSRVFLNSRVKGRNDYINAVRVNGHKSKDAFHVTQIPLGNTVVDFWRMIQDYEISVVVVLTTQLQAKDVGQFLPAKNRPMDVLERVASVRSSMTSESYRVIDINLGDTSGDNNEYMNMEDIAANSGRAIRVHEITLSPDQPCLDYVVVLDVYNRIRARKDGKTVTVMCLDGATYSGQFVACCNLFEMIESEQEIDVFQVTKYIRDSRPEFIGSLEQYRGLYEAVRTYLIQYDTYANC